MYSTALLWLFFNLLSIAILAFYSMMEMACVSFNKVRLQYYVAKGEKRAMRLNYLLQHPSNLFGTTLIGVNIALVIGSECARECYSALGLSPDLAPLTQVILVVIFGELAPMFAARHYAEHVAILGIPLLYLSAKVMTPLLWCIGIVSKGCYYLIGGNKEADAPFYLNQEELQNILEEHGEETAIDTDSEEFEAISTNIFSLRHKDVSQVMSPLKIEHALPANATVKQLEALLQSMPITHVPLYAREISNIIGIIYPRDMIRASPNQRVRDFARPPWFVSETANLMQLLKQFRTNSESVAIILNSKGKACGIIQLSDIIEEIFGAVSLGLNRSISLPSSGWMLVGKTFPGDMSMEEFHRQFGVWLDPLPQLTLSELIAIHLGHNPEKGDSIYLAPFELTVKETSLMNVKTVSISTRQT